MKNKKFALVFLILFLSFATLLLVKKNFFTKQINEGFSEFNNENALQDVPLNNENLKFSAPLTPKNAYAIVVGISDYPGSTSDLTYCDDDAQAVYSLLINDFNFKPNNIIYLQDSSATKNAISNAFDQVASQISSDDIFFFYYSGHGGASTSNDGVHSYSIDSPHPYPNNYDNMWSIFYTDAAYMRVHFDHFDLEYDYDWVYLGDSDLADGWYYEGYSGYSTGFWSGWIPLLSDNRMYIRMITDSSIAEWGFSIDQFEVEIYDGTHFLCSYDSIPYNPNNFYLDSLLNSKLDNIHCDERYVILDACNTGGMIPEVQQVGRYIMTACSDEESSLESPLLEHGVFTNYFLESFDNAADSNGDGVRSMEECYSYIYSNTVSHSESMGYTHHPQEYDGISGEVMLSTSFGNISLIPIGNILSYSFDLYGLGLIEELKVAVCNNSAGVIYNTLDLTTIPASNTGFGEYSGTIQLNDVSGLSGYGIYAKINGYYIIVLNQTYSEDTDSDGLDDVFEIMTDLNPETNDTDADGLEDMLEYYGDTDPLLNDTDVDGLLDGDEILTYFTNATNPDTDNDGLSDGVEVLVYTTNPLLQDTEGDGMDDG
ncbi:MAG: caspase family protein, partial [Candidatus Hodarchaeota archaeon]